MKVVSVSVILYVANIVSTNFFSLYVTQRLGIADSYLAFFPILNAAVHAGIHGWHTTPFGCRQIQDSIVDWADIACHGFIAADPDACWKHRHDCCLCFLWLPSRVR